MVLFMVKNRIYKENVCLFISMVLFYDYKFLKIDTQRKCVSFYFSGSFLWLQIFKNGYK